MSFLEEWMKLLVSMELTGNVLDSEILSCCNLEEVIRFWKKKKK